jgi:hypothetical protein
MMTSRTRLLSPKHISRPKSTLLRLTVKTILFLELDYLDPVESNKDTKDIDNEFIEIENDDPVNWVEEHLEMMDEPFSSVPNVMAAVACFTWNIDAKLTHVEHKYGKTIKQL